MSRRNAVEPPRATPAAPLPQDDGPPVTAGIAAAAVLVVLAAAVATFHPVVDHGFLNWDDPGVVAANPWLRQPLPDLAAWALTTTHLQHYQPLAWFAYAGLGSARAVHTASVVLHALNAGLLCLIIALLARRPSGRDHDWWLAAGAAAVFAVHPMRVEPVAWASALPYLLSYAPLLVAVGAWILWLRGGGTAWYLAALGAFALSQGVRVTAPLAPAALVALAGLERGPSARRWPAVLRGAVPFALVVAPLAWAEAGARNIETLADIGLAPRVAWSLTHPAWYAWQMVAPGARTALDVLPRQPVADWGTAAVGAIAMVVAVALTAQLSTWRTAAAVWGSYLLLLLPVVGLFPSGVQLTADRYAYGPGLVLAAALGVALTRAPAGLRHGALVALGAAAVMFAQSSRTELSYWRDSLSLWTRAAALDPDNDVALYNLADAQAAAGHLASAMDSYTRLLALVPDHAPAQAARARLIADGEEARGDAAAQAGRLREAALAYGRALEADPARATLHARRGMALAQAGDLAAALPDLQAAAADGPAEPAVAGALALALRQGGRTADALAVLSRAYATHPDDLALAANYARLLLTAEPPTLRDAARGLQVARRVAEATGMRDPRLLDTLGLGLAAAGRDAEARDTWQRASALARQGGDAGLAAAIEARLQAPRQ
ncbi:MAG: hypothetical protein R2708_05415 [Vicinamibacterales bacterium]